MSIACPVPRAHGENASEAKNYQVMHVEIVCGAVCRGEQRRDALACEDREDREESMEDERRN